MDKRNPSEKKNRRAQRQKQLDAYVKYSGLAFQMAALILLGYWVGRKLDKVFGLSFPAFTIALILIFLSLSFYSLIKSLPKD